MQQSISNHLLKQILYLGVLFLLGMVLFWQLSAFIPAALGAITFYVLMRNRILFLVEKKRWKKSLAAFILMLLSFLLILLPITLMVSLLSSKINYAVRHSNQIIQMIKSNISIVEKRLGYEILSNENIQNISTWIAKFLPSLLNATFNTLIAIIVMYCVLYFMLTNIRVIEAGIVKFLSLKRKNTSLLRKEIRNTIYSNAIGIPIVAILQGIVALLAYWLLGVPDPLFWFVLTCIASVLPFVGAALGYVPVALLFFADGETVRGIIMLAYGIGVIGTVDNVFRFFLQKKIGDVHPLITLFGVILGINLFGFWGLVFGPLLISLFILLVKMYNNEFSTTSAAVS